MGKMIDGTPRKVRHISFACTEDDIDMIALTAAAIGVSRSSLIRMLLLEKYNSLVQDRYFADLDLKVEEVQNVPN